MEHQDWTDVVIKGSKPVNVQEDLEKKHRRTMAQHAIKMQKLENPDALPPKRSGLSLGQQIQAARASKGLTQKELAQRLNVKSDIISSYENGTAVYSGIMISKLQSILGVKFDR